MQSGRRELTCSTFRLQKESDMQAEKRNIYCIFYLTAQETPSTEYSSTLQVKHTTIMQRSASKKNIETTKNNQSRTHKKLPTSKY